MDNSNGILRMPLHHITIRVPWHDNGWKGTVCNKPCNNTACLDLTRIGKVRNDKKEESLAGQSIEDLEVDDHPPCVAEHATFMADFDITHTKQHPYEKSSPTTHGHMAPTPLTYEAYSAAAVPFRWMLREQVEGNAKFGVASKADQLHLDWEPDREPEMNFKTSWVQEGTNQRLMLDTFFSAVKPEDSLVFFYAKRTPLSEESRRVIVGAGRVKNVGTSTEYEYYDKDDIPLSGYLWERNIKHSIRSGFEDGFLLPYQELIALSEADESIDLEAHIAFAPSDFFEQYSHGSELLPHDGAIASLLECERAIQEFKKTMEGPWAKILSWINSELNRLWEIRGPFPGFGSSLKAFGIEHGTLLAWYIYEQLLEEDAILKINPWDRFAALLTSPQQLPKYLQREVGPTLADKWQALSTDRRSLLDLLSRCAINEEQATRYYQLTEKQRANITVLDSDVLANPYLLFECDRNQLDPIQFGAVDRGVFPEDNIRAVFPLAGSAIVNESIDRRRVRALCTLTLSEAMDDGHTLLPNNWLIDRIRNKPLRPECFVDEDVLNLLDGYLDPVLVRAEMADGAGALQLQEFATTKKIISTAVTKRIKGKRNTGEHDWSEMVTLAIDQSMPEMESERNVEAKAREEKSAALAEIYRSRLSVLVGSAGTGKSTLLKALCHIEQVKEGGLLLLAPTGKARVRLEQATGLYKQGLTIAQFLLRYKRYEGKTGRYLFESKADACSQFKTVIIDECSMLTEDQLAALLSGLKNVARLILVGDPQQLPPIGAGRPFVDIVRRLKPDDLAGKFPEVDFGYAGLTVPRRQIAEGGEEREDLLLADFFSGRSLDPGADEIWSKAANNKLDRLKLVSWSTPDDLGEQLVKTLVEELGLESDEDEPGFGASIGGSISAKTGNVYFNNRWKNNTGAAESVEAWQILSPLRMGQTGVDAVNRNLQIQFRPLAKAMATEKWRKIPKPMGPQGILWGDKVINVRNKSDRRVYPAVEDPYVANGDIGVVVGQTKWKPGGKLPSYLEVELASQTGSAYSSGSPQYKYYASEFSGENASPPLELAYALTVHKTQGSEFGITFLIIPNPCRLLSREMLYTALTRHKERVVLFHQGEFRDIQRFSSDDCSEVARRLTNMFVNPNPVEIEIYNRHIFLDSNLIHRTQRGERVRSKSELIIADKLYAAGIDYEYEPRISLNGVERYPDFVIEDDESGETWYWEHLGMMSVPAYLQRWEAKLEDYKAAGILPIEEGGGEFGSLVTTMEYEGLGFDSQLIDGVIAKILD
jgi:energy-coupling factor transporter ATP-binding protein EcfA2